MSTQNQAASAKSSAKENNYFNLHTLGLGYISRVREVPVRKGAPFVSASIRAMFGEKGVKDGVQYTPYDVKAATEQAEVVLRLVMNDANDKNKRVMVQFKISDSYIDTFRYTQGEKQGQTGTVLKGRLLTVYRAWVQEAGQNGKPNGEMTLVYELPRAEDAEQRTGTQG